MTLRASIHVTHPVSEYNAGNTGCLLSAMFVDIIRASILCQIVLTLKGRNNLYHSFHRHPPV